MLGLEVVYKCIFCGKSNGVYGFPPKSIHLINLYQESSICRHHSAPGDMGHWDEGTRHMIPAFEKLINSQVGKKAVKKQFQ